MRWNNLKRRFLNDEVVAAVSLSTRNAKMTREYVTRGTPRLQTLCLPQNLSVQHMFEVSSYYV
jgi:hypothetical protein